MDFERRFLWAQLPDACFFLPTSRKKTYSFNQATINYSKSWKEGGVDPQSKLSVYTDIPQIINF